MRKVHMETYNYPFTLCGSQVRRMKTKNCSTRDTDGVTCKNCIRILEKEGRI